MFKAPVDRPKTIDQVVTEEIKGMGAIPPGANSRIATLSFPVRSEKNAGPIRNNSGLIVEIIRKRRPALLLCAGWTVPGQDDLSAIESACRGLQSIVVVETDTDPRYYRISHRGSVDMGEQHFSLREDTETKGTLQEFAEELRARTFQYQQWSALLLICGEVMVVQGRDKVSFHWSAPQALKDVVRAPNALILNPTHTRMGNYGSVKAWRTFLSGEGRAYVSVSNWDLTTGQQPSETLHSLWYDGQARAPAECFREHDRFDYREWDLPSI